MESTFRFRPCSHHRRRRRRRHRHRHRHRHHHHHHPCCHHRHHQHHHHCNCHHLCPRMAPLPLQYSQPNFYKETPPAYIALVEEEPEHTELDNEEEEEEEDDMVFVLTDEWRELFAKSEAKRKLEKQAAKKKDRRL